MNSPDSIEIHRLQVRCHVGVPDAEIAESQLLWISLTLVPIRNFSDLDDEIEKTVDYHAVSVAVERLAAAKPRRLIETLANDIANALLSAYPLRQVRVMIEKRILPNTDWVGVQVTRERDSTR